jgi:hypothetical protein
MDAEGAGHLADGLSFLEKPPGKILLLTVHLFGAPESNTTLLSVGATGSSALPNQVAFELSYPRENGHDHLPGVGSGIGPWLGDGLEAGSGVADHFNYLEQVAGGAGQAIELPDGYDVTFAKLIKHPVQFGSITISPGDLFAEDSCTTCLLEGIDLKSESLVFGRNASVANFHSAVTKSFAKYIAMTTHSARYFREAVLADFELICSFRKTYMFCDSPEHVGGYCACWISHG